MIKMVGRRATVTLSLLCTLLSCAVMAPSAGAVVANGTTAWTCTAEPKPTEKSVGFSDEHCTVAASGTKVKFVHKAIPETLPNFVSATNSGTTKTTPSKLKGTLGEVVWEVEALAYTTCENGATLFNLTSFMTKQMFSDGRYCGEFNEVKVTKPANCSVEKNKIETQVGALWTTRVEEKGGEELMWVEFGAKSPEEPVISEFEFLGAACALKNKMVEVTGSAKANVQNSKAGLIGSTLNFTTKTTGETLKANGAKAEFEGEFTPRMAEKENTDPIALTTKKEP
jgi:hypothetical protein